MDLLIKGGTVVTATESFIADVAVNKGKIVSRDSLMEYLWQTDCFVDDGTLSVNVARVRKKLEEVGMKDAIETKRGLGYIMP